MLKILELFGGIGACTQALKRLGIDFEIVDYVEIDKYAVKSYNAINGTNFEPQDITKWNKQIDVDLIMHGSPCQDFSLAGLQAGGDEGSGTRSSLMYETLRIVENLKPKYVIWENVKNIISKKHVHNFNNYINRMSELGYKSFYKVLNAKDYGIPQNRERVFTISLLNGTNYDFPKPIPLKLKLKDMLDENVDEKYYLDDDKIEKISHWKSFQKPFEKVNGNNSIVQTLTARGKIQDKDYSDTLVASTGTGGGNVPLVPQVIGGIGEKKSNGGTQWYQQDRIYDNNVGLSVSTTAIPYYPDNHLRIRKLTPKECWRLMGFSDECFEKAEKVNSNAQLYKQAGNSIVVDVLYKIFKNLLGE